MASLFFDLMLPVRLLPSPATPPRNNANARSASSQSQPEPRLDDIAMWERCLLQYGTMASPSLLVLLPPTDEV